MLTHSAKSANDALEADEQLGGMSEKSKSARLGLTWAYKVLSDDPAGDNLTMLKKSRCVIYLFR